MPIYEYHCHSCGAETEKLQRLGAPDLTDCPACGRPALTRRVSAAGFRLKGGGWYETDFKSAAKKNVAGDAAPASASSEKADKSEKTGTADAGGGCGKPACGSGACAA